MAAPNRAGTTTGPIELLALGALAAAAWRSRAALARLAWEEVATKYPIVGQHPRLVAAGAVGAVLLLVLLAGLAANGARRWKHRRASGGAIADAGDLAAKPPPVMAWALPDLIGRGVITLLSAPPKTGKTTLLWVLARAMQQGGTVYGLRVTRMRILWCTEEGQSFDRDARKYGIKPGLVRVLRRQDMGVVEWPSLVATIRQIAWKQHCAIVVFDTLRAWCPQAEQDGKGANEVMTLVRQQLTKPGLGVVFVHHDTKAGGDYGTGVAGTYGLPGAVDQVVQLARVPDDEHARRLHAFGRYAERKMTARLIDGAYVVPAAPVPDVPTTDAAEDTTLTVPLRHTLYALPLAPAGGIPVEWLRSVLGLTRQATMLRVADLLELGLVERDGAGTKVAPYLWRARTRPEGEWDGATYPPGFNDDAYRRTAHWTRVRQDALARSGGICGECRQGTAIDAHHKDYRHLWAEPPTSITALCVRCHRRAHAAG